MQVTDFLPGDEVYWFRKTRTCMIKIPAVVTHRKKVAVAIKIIDPSGTPAMRYVNPEFLEKKKLSS